LLRLVVALAVVLGGMAGCGRLGIDSLAIVDAGPDADLGLSREQELATCPVLATSTDGSEALIAWTSFAVGQSSGEVRFARLDSTGKAVLGPVSVASGGDTARASAVFEVAGGYLVFFESDNELRVVRLGADASVSSSEVVATTVYSAAVAQAGSGFFATWEQSSGNRDIDGVPLDGTGSPTQASALVATGGDEPAALETSAGTLIAYGFGGGYSAVVVDAAGTVVDGPVAAGASGLARAIAMEGRSDGSILVVHRGNNIRTELQFNELGVAPLQSRTTAQPLSPSNFDEWTEGSVAVTAGGLFVVARLVDDGAFVTKIAVQPVDVDSGPGAATVLDSGGRASCPAVIGLNGGLLAAYLVERLQTRALVVQDVVLP